MRARAPFFNNLKNHLGTRPRIAAPQILSDKHRLLSVFFLLGFLAGTILPLYGPWVAEVQAAKKLELKVPKPLDSAVQVEKANTTGGVTDAAKATAIPIKDPVTTYFEEQEKNKDKPAKPARLIPANEIKEKRTAFSNTYLNTEGGMTERVYSEPVNYRTQNGKGSWEPVNGELKEDNDYNKAESSKESLISRILPGKPFIKKGLRQDSGILRTSFKALNESDGITVGFDGTKTFKVTLVGANPQTNPELGTFEDGLKYTLYRDAWKNADVYYEQRGASLKETIVLKSKNTPTTFGFKFSGAKLSYGKDDKGQKDGTINAILDDGTKVVIPQLTVMSKVTGPLENPKMKYELVGNTVFVVLDPVWFATISPDKFPLLVDPTYDYRGVSTGIPGGDLGQFIAYDNRGYRCNSNVCDVYAGSLNDGGWKNWRTMMRLPLTSVYGKTVTWANIYTERVNRPNYWNGFNGNRPYEITWANCFGYHCFSGAPRASTHIDWAGNFNATALMDWISKNNVGDGWLMIKAGNEGDINSFKSFAGSRTYLDVNFRHWNQQTALPTLAEPAKNATIVTSRPTLKANGVSDPDGDIVKYAFHLLDSNEKIVAHSGELDTSWWTIPDDILIDGEKYSWRVFVMERNAGNPSVIESGWRQQPEVRSFTYDMRTGKDKTQTYDETGPLSVSLNRGNAYTGANTHAMGALGGTIGLGLDYNTPGLSRYGLSATYRNGTAMDSPVAIKVNDPNIDMVWGSGSPYPGTVQADNFNVNWKGYFVAPETGNYTFVSGRDDRLIFTIDGKQQFDHGCCGWTRAGAPIYLTKGQAYPVDAWYFEATGYAAAHLNVVLPSGAEVRVPTEWFRTLPDVTSSDNRGLSARFYATESSNTNFVVSQKTPLVFATKVPEVNRDWGTGSLVPYDVGPFRDYMIANYSGYVTIPKDGKYQIGGGSDDGLRIRLGGKEVASRWMPQGYTEVWSAEMDFKAGQIVPISVDYFEVGGAARVTLQWKSSTNAVSTGIIPGQYLSTRPQIVPRAWNVSADADGGIPYELLQVKPSGNVELVDSDGFVHAYTWSNGGFKPPTDEDGYLVRNADGTFRLTDADGRVYDFSVEGQIVRVSSAIDDRNPAALQYEYRDTSTTQYGAYPRLHKIKDGIDPSRRYGQLYYWGEEGASDVCKISANYEAPVVGYLCAFKTFPDERVTRFQYSGGQLARVEQPGNQFVDYGYESDGRMKTIRDTAANDAYAYGKRTLNGTEVTQISYDQLFRVNKVIAPAPFGDTVPDGQANNRAEHIFEYGSASTKLHYTGVPAPKGYQQYIEYDHLYRTTKACNNEGLCNASLYHAQKDLLLSVTDAFGLMATTIYDSDDRPIAQYGPALPSDFTVNRTPFDLNKVPRSEIRYDEGIIGPAVTWYDYRDANGGILSGAPRKHTTGFDPAMTDRFAMNTAASQWPVAPITKSADAQGIGFAATAKVYAPVTGAYNLTITHEDAVRIWVDDNLVLDKWSNRGDANITSTVAVVLNKDKPSRFKFDYANADNGRIAFSMNLTGNGLNMTDSRWGAAMRPGYNLQTSQTVYDSQLGNKTSSVQYGDTAELGLPQGVTSSSSSTSFTIKTTYEAPGVGFWRKTSTSLPGGNTTRYSYYDATETADNPCTTTVESIPQGGQLRSKVTQDPDGSGSGEGVSSETRYDSTGRTIASRVNNGAWACTEFDERGRVVRTQVPDEGGRQGRTMTSNYAVDGNPFVSSVTDSVTGTMTMETDLFGRTLRLVDTFGYETKLTYDSLGRVSKKESIKGVETSTFDEYSRPTSYLLDNVAYASMTYDSLGRIANVEYPQATNGSGKLKLSQIKRDSTNQNTGSIYTFADGSTYDESVTRTTQTGLVTGNTIAYGGKTASSNFQYDGSGRLTSAVVDNWKYDYEFGAQDASCAAVAGFNANASLNGNRTKGVITNQLTGEARTTTSCYNLADQLVSTSDTEVGAPKYDSEGNVTELAGNGTPITLTYNASGQNIAIAQGGNKVEYTKDAAGTVLVKKEYRNGSLDKVYRNASGSLLNCNVSNHSECAIQDRYIALPGAVLLTLANAADGQTRKTYSIQNFHGDSVITAGANGIANSSVSFYDPFGGKVASATYGTSGPPENASDTSMGWATAPSRKQETLFSLAIMQMGARVYLPSLGIFLQMDPVVGGTPNAYTYVLDPINFADYGGKWGVPKWLKTAAIVVVVAVVVVGVVAACIAFCAAAGAAIAAAAALAAPAIVSAAATIATVGYAVSRAAPAIRNVVSTVSKGGKAGNVVTKSQSSYQATQVAAKSAAPTRITNPPSSSLFKPGPYAQQSISAPSTSQVFNGSVRTPLNKIGNTSGCHSCGTMSPGTKTGNWVPDHMPVTKLMEMSGPQRLYPQCLACSRQQGLEVAKYLRDINNGGF